MAEQQKEYIADLLRERIYATLALIAVLISIDPEHFTPLHAEFLIAGTIISLWAASIVSVLMARRMVYQGSLDRRHERQDQLRRHAPMLAAMIFPLGVIALAMFRIISLGLAVNIALAGSLFLLVGWSVLSARSLKVKRVPTAVLVIAELAIGLAVVSLKVIFGH